MGFCLRGDNDRAVITATPYGLEDPVSQPQCWQDKQDPSTFSRILVFTQCKKMTW